MNIHVRLGAGLVQYTGNPRLVITLAESASVADLVNQLCLDYPPLAQKLDTAVPMVAGRHAALTDPLAAGQEVALLLPVAGGSN